jgi:hypothetical protein
MTIEFKQREIVEAFKRAAAFANADFKSAFVYVDPTQPTLIWQTNIRENVPESALICIEIEPNYVEPEESR